MGSQHGRRFRVSDAMILIAVMAVGLALMRRFSPEEYLIPYQPGLDVMNQDPTAQLSPKLWANWALTTIIHRSCYAYPLVGIMTLAVLALRFRHPRPRLGRLMRQPGTVAGLAAATGLGTAVCEQILFSLKSNIYTYDPYFLPWYVIGHAVGTSWIILALGGRWRPESSWIDRAGCVLGVLWASMVPLSVLRSLAI